LGGTEEKVCANRHEKPGKVTCHQEKAIPEGANGVLVIRGPLARIVVRRSPVTSIGKKRVPVFQFQEKKGGEQQRKRGVVQKWIPKGVILETNKRLNPTVE